LLMVGSLNTINATLYDKLNYNFIRDIAPVASVMRYPYVMLLNPSVPAKSVPEFISYAKANPRNLNMASPGIGSGPHIAGELFKMMAGVDMVHVPYRGSGPALTDLLGGQGRCRSPPCPRRSNTSGPASCAPSRWSPRLVRRCCPMSRLSGNLCPATKRAPGTASAHRRPRRPR